MDAARFIENGGADFVEDFRRAGLGDVVGTLGVTVPGWVAFVWLRVDECCAAVSAFSGRSVVASMTPSPIL